MSTLQKERQAFRTCKWLFIVSVLISFGNLSPVEVKSAVACPVFTRICELSSLCEADAPANKQYIGPARAH